MTEGILMKLIALITWSTQKDDSGKVTGSFKGQGQRWPQQSCELNSYWTTAAYMNQNLYKYFL